MITFRDGPTGRRAGLIGGPDVWEVAMPRVAAVDAIAGEQIEDRVIYLERVESE